MSTEPYQKIIEDYPEYISKEQLYKLINVSKRVAKYYLDHGIIPCINTGSATHKYRILTKDVVTFLIIRQKHPDLFRVSVSTTRRKLIPIAYSQALKTKMESIYSPLLHQYPDVLSIAQVSEVTGYSEESVKRWCRSKKIHYFEIRRKYLIPKEKLLLFLSSEEYHAISNKSAAHKRILRLVHEATEV